ncbi:syndecan-1 [Carettochelys insculpta]|uniref:syndecan-1 n=1 Tax=Carettochelys insculpta TaxID=44489 RepID=UPI003EC035F5
MINVSAAAWLLALVVQAACAQTTNLNLPPEDLDSSGDDDDDAFSGSGAGSLPDHPPVVAWNVTLERANSSSRSAIAPGASVHDPAVHGTESLAETEMVSSAPASDKVPDEAILSVKDETRELGSEKPTTNQAVIPTRSSTTQRPPLGVTTDQASDTVHVTEPGIHHLGPSDTKETIHLNFTTISDEDIGSPTVVPSWGIIPMETTEMLSPEESSGDQGDFTFNEEPVVREESELVDSSRDAEAAGTSQGLMDRKDVLAGVITGGIVGLLFAVFLVGFMLYRMKKKDEGSYSLDEPKQSNGGYQKPQKQEEFYA